MLNSASNLLASPSALKIECTRNRFRRSHHQSTVELCFLEVGKLPSQQLSDTKNIDNHPEGSTLRATVGCSNAQQSFQISENSNHWSTASVENTLRVSITDLPRSTSTTVYQYDSVSTLIQAPSPTALSCKASRRKQSEGGERSCIIVS